MQSRDRKGAEKTAPLRSRLCMDAALREVALLRLGDCDDQARDVIFRAGIEGKLPQAIGAFLDILFLQNELEQLFVGDDAAETIGAEQEAVSGLNRHDLD